MFRTSGINRSKGVNLDISTKVLDSRGSVDQIRAQDNRQIINDMFESDAATKQWSRAEKAKRGRNLFNERFAVHQLQASEHDKFAAHLYQARKAYRFACDRTGRNGKQIERCVISTFRVARAWEISAERPPTAVCRDQRRAYQAPRAIKRQRDFDAICLP